MNNILLATSSGTINLNVDQKTLDMCVKTTTNFSHSIYNNICNGQVVVVANGTIDKALTLILFLAGIVLLGLFLGMIWKMIFDF